MPAKVDPLQLRVSAPSRLAAAASSFSAALISWAGVAAHPVKMNAADRAILDRIDMRAGTESSRVIFIRLHSRTNPPEIESEHGRATIAAGSLSRRERGGVRGYKPSIGPNPLTPTLLPTELGFTRVRSLNDVAEVGNIRLRLGRGSHAVPCRESVLTEKVYRRALPSGPIVMP